MEPGVLFGIASAASFGAGDFAGGAASRRASVLLVAAAANVVGLVPILALLLIVRPALTEPSAIAFGAFAGISGGLGLVALYRGLSLGSMGIVTALSGVGSVVLPLLVSFGLRGAAVSPLQALGLAAAMAAAGAASGATLRGVRREAVALALFAAIGLGMWFVFLDLAAHADELWALLASRGAGTLLIGTLALVRGGSGLRSAWLLVVAAGVLDVTGNATSVLARASIPVGIAAALAGLYPIITMLLARFVLRESLPPLGIGAVVLAVAGIVLISIG